MKDFDMEVLARKVSLTREEAAFYGGIGRDTLSRYIKNDELPHFFAGRDLRIVRTDLEDFLKSCAESRRVL